MKSKIGASNSIARLTETVWKCLGTSATEFFEVGPSSDVSQLKDQIKLELTAFQLEACVPEIYIKDNSNKKKMGDQPSYWKYAYALAGIQNEPVDEEYKYRNIDDFWSDMANNMDNTTGAIKYPKLSKLALHCLLVLPHGNSDPERGFSINKNILKIHGYSTKEDTLIALRFIKYTLILKGGHLKIPLSKDLFVSCRGARSSYLAFLEAQRSEKEMEKKRKLDQEIEREKAKENENAIEEENTDLGEIMKKKQLDMNKLKMCQAQIAMGVKRKNELQLEVDHVEKKIKKAEEELKE